MRHKKDPGKPIKNELYILQYAKGTSPSQNEAMLKQKKIEPIAFAIVTIQLHQSVDILLHF